MIAAGQPGLVIAIVGAARTGKTTLARRLCERLAAETGLRCACVSALPEADLQEQARRIDEAAAQHDIVLADTAPLGRRYRYALTLLTALDSVSARDEQVDATLRRALLEAGLGWSVVAGHGEARLDAALDAITPVLLRWRALPRSGLLTRLQERDAAQPAWRWVCEKCDSPECEHALRR
jgi:hypothetical protein